MGIGFFKKTLALALATIFIFSCVPTFASTVTYDTTSGTQESKLIKNGQNLLTVGQKDGGLTADYYFTATKTGLASINLCKVKEISDSSGNTSYTLSSTHVKGTIKLYDSKGNALSTVCNHTTYSSVFGVVKGNTYHIKVAGKALKYAVCYSLTAATDLNISTKSKAKNIKISSSAQSLFTANAKKESDWYKIKLSNPRKTYVVININNMSDSGYLYVQSYNGTQAMDTADTIKCDGTVKHTIYLSEEDKKADAGTYYIKITKSKYASGQYKITCK